MKEVEDQVCVQCGWFKRDHRQGYCYKESDENTDYFYSDRKFMSIESLKGKLYSRSFDGKIIVKEISAN